MENRQQKTGNQQNRGTKRRRSDKITEIDMKSLFVELKIIAKTRHTIQKDLYMEMEADFTDMLGRAVEQGILADEYDEVMQDIVNRFDELNTLRKKIVALD